MLVRNLVRNLPQLGLVNSSTGRVCRYELRSEGDKTVCIPIVNMVTAR